MAAAGGVGDELPHGISHKLCAYQQCTSPSETSKHFRIEEGCFAGGQNWSGLVGHVLCETCIQTFIATGTLERALPVKVRLEERRCCYEHCRSPTESIRFVQVKEGHHAGNKDWSSLVGLVLCAACYAAYMKNGTLERGPKPVKLKEEERRCCNEKCENPSWSNRYYRVHEGCKAGNRDWSELTGMVLCEACYGAYKKKGKFGRTKLRKEEHRCSYEHCQSPTQSCRFRRIKVGCTAGGQDWAGLEGSVLCEACYLSYRKSGKLQRSLLPPKGKLEPQEKRCCYEQCANPGQSCRFHRIKEGWCAGGWDWSSLQGLVLCDSCYDNFLKNGTLDRDAPQKPKFVMRCCNSQCSSTTESRDLCKVRKGCCDGAQDWGGLEGLVFCRSCYDMFVKTGSFKRPEEDGQASTEGKKRKKREGIAEGNEQKVESSKKSVQTAAGNGMQPTYGMNGVWGPVAGPWDAMMGQRICLSNWHGQWGGMGGWGGMAGAQGDVRAGEIGYSETGMQAAGRESVSGGAGSLGGAVGGALWGQQGYCAPLCLPTTPMVPSQVSLPETQPAP